MAGTTRSEWRTIAYALLIILGCAAALPFAIGYLYAWTWVLPYASVCKSSLLESDFTTEDYHLYLLNHGCRVDDDIRRYVRDWYAALDNSSLYGLPIGPKRVPAPQARVEAAAERAVLIFHRQAQVQGSDEVVLADAVRSYLGRFRSFRFADQDCEPAGYCDRAAFWGDDAVSQFFAWVSGKYLSFAEPMLLEGIDLGAVQVAAVWQEGPLLRGGLLIAYTLATGALATALFELVKSQLKK
ncbi:MAG TPA: hypothetical protein VKT99_16645 [Xanthobacteraceae bacterium]|jgi:hypothetical protein|nr:hypothetical protein [Xanthobacteraceae bacterium]